RWINDFSRQIGQVHPTHVGPQHRNQRDSKAAPLAGVHAERPGERTAARLAKAEQQNREGNQRDHLCRCGEALEGGCPTNRGGVGPGKPPKHATRQPPVPKNGKKKESRRVSRKPQTDRGKTRRAGNEELCPTKKEGHLGSPGLSQKDVAPSSFG